MHPKYLGTAVALFIRMWFSLASCVVAAVAARADRIASMQVILVATITIKALMGRMWLVLLLVLVLML
jgi:hypothetical protein